MTNTREKLHRVISHAKADVNLCAYALPMLNEVPEKERVDLFKTFILEFRNTLTDEEMELPITINKEEEHILKNRYSRMVNAYIEVLIERNLPEVYFYNELWRYITDSNVFSDAKGSIIALYMCALDKRLPYYALDKSRAVKMDQETYMMYLDIIGNDTFAKMEYILNGDWKQKTEQASMLLELLEKYDDVNTKTVFLSRIISHYTSEMHKIQRAIMQYLVD